MNNNTKTKTSIENLLEQKRKGTAVKTAQLMPSREMVKGMKAKSKRRKSGILG